MMPISFDYGKEYGTPAFPIIHLAITGQSDQTIMLKGIVDSGADATMIPLKILEQVDARQLDEGWIRTISSQRYAISLYAVTIQIGEYKIYGIEAIANEKTDEIIIGRDVLNELIVTLDGLGEVTKVHC